MDIDLKLNIDENNLLNEWKSQASMMLEYGIQLADAMQEEDGAKAKLAVVAAEMDRDMRANPADYGIDKLTEAAISSAILVQPEHKIVTKKLDDAHHEVRILRAVVDALSHRKSTLQGMTDLFLRQWYANPTSDAQPAELKEATKSVTTRRRKRSRFVDEE
jgi:hypothetical protein